MKEIRIGMAFDGDYLKVREGEREIMVRIIKISNNYNAWCERDDGKRFWINTSVDKDVIAAYRKIEPMLDKNGIEIKTGDAVRISGAYFKNDNGLFFITHSPGDPFWNGNYHALKRLCSNGKLSAGRSGSSSWPIAVYTNSRLKRAVATEHNKINAKIEIIHDLPTHSRIKYFKQQIKEYEDLVNGYELPWFSGKDLEGVEASIKNYKEIVERLKAEG